ncbi:creatininase family protein [Salinadaptatus halalkaliphilus]|uniref:Creatininase family protein n=1 Tax=Salinadaptatus halalkaliphilus TaxID=2419781 RepID=A0A4S3TGK0_9EURY|nr:creatininase family protein [Salinadaptatus halalkaliphilus]THE63011.1 creatininase family protein [Salinadaptatus halalkaliphilus]
MYLPHRTWQELTDYVGTESVAIVPLGSTEQHGPHLPEGTDYMIAEALARAAAERSGFLCTSPVRIGVSSHHRQFHGTMWVEPPIFRDYVESFSRNLTAHGIDRIVYVNAHGGNVAHLREVGRRLHDDGTAYAIEWMWDESIPELIEEVFETPGPHGGPKETAMIMHIAEELVREDRLEDARDGGTVFDDGAGRVHGATTFYDTIENSENGVFGDQTDATPEIGKRLFDAATEQLVALLEWLDDRPREQLLPAPHVDPQPSAGDRSDTPDRS